MEVKVIERKQASGNRTLYLEYYETGFRKRENLHLTLYPEDGNTKLAKINKETRHQAEVIRSERILNPPSWLFKDPFPWKQQRNQSASYRRHSASHL